MSNIHGGWGGFGFQTQWGKHKIEVTGKYYPARPAVLGTIDRCSPAEPSEIDELCVTVLRQGNKKWIPGDSTKVYRRKASKEIIENLKLDGAFMGKIEQEIVRVNKETEEEYD
jgi:hypothetical protein